jgi:hypothetical protein
MGRVLDRSAEVAEGMGRGERKVFERMTRRKSGKGRRRRSPILTEEVLFIGIMDQYGARRVAAESVLMTSWEAP